MRAATSICLLLGLTAAGGCSREFHIITPIPRLTTDYYSATRVTDAVLGDDARHRKLWEGERKRNSGIGRANTEAGELGQKAEAEGEATKGLAPDANVGRVPGVWLQRTVVERAGVLRNKLRLLSIEILYCPASTADFTECRLGVGWVYNHHPMGESSE